MRHGTREGDGPPYINRSGKKQAIRGKVLPSFSGRVLRSTQPRVRHSTVTIRARGHGKGQSTHISPAFRTIQSSKKRKEVVDDGENQSRGC